MTAPSAVPFRASLDHFGAIVRDLEKGAAHWERMGFTLSPLSRQSGRMPGRDEDGPWATANRCAIFQQGYLELIGVVDATAFNPWTRFLSRFEGMHLLALRVPQADAAFADLAKRTASLNAPVQRERKLEVDGVERIMRFRNIFSRDEHYPEGRYIVLEHQTPDYLWQPRYLSHPNGAQALDTALVCAEDIPAQAERLETIVGAPPTAGDRGELIFRPLLGGSIELHGRAQFEERYGWRPPALPAFAGAQVRFANRETAAHLMEDNGIPIERRGSEWFVGPAHTNGFILRLSQ